MDPDVLDAIPENQELRWATGDSEGKKVNLSSRGFSPDLPWLAEEDRIQVPSNPSSKT